MSDKTTLCMLFDYNAWADQILFDAMRALPEGALHKETGTLFKSMVGTLNHNYQVDLIWRAHMLEQKHGFTSRRDVLHDRFDDIVAAQIEMNAWFSAWCSAQTDAAFAEEVSFNFVSGNAGRMHRGGMLLHIVNHKTYHRGWIAQMFFEHGFVPPESDLSIYLTESAAQKAA